MDCLAKSAYIDKPLDGLAISLPKLLHHSMDQWNRYSIQDQTQLDTILSIGSVSRGLQVAGPVG